MPSTWRMTASTPTCKPFRPAANGARAFGSAPAESDERLPETVGESDARDAARIGIPVRGDAVQRRRGSPDFDDRAEALRRMPHQLRGYLNGIFQGRERFPLPPPGPLH